MTPEQRETVQKWIDNLRECGDLQITDTLCKETDDGLRFCAIGLLCHTVSPNWMNNNHPVYRANAFWTPYEPGQIVIIDTFTFKAITGLPVHIRNTVIVLNDLEESTFAEIADYIEACIGEI